MGDLNLPQVTAGQNQKNVTINDMGEKLDLAMTSEIILDFTSGNITLTDAQFRENFSFSCDNVVAARDLTLPGTLIKRFFIIFVQIDETFDVSVKRGSTTIVVTPGERRLLYADGTTNGLSDVSAGGGGGGAFIDLADVDPATYSGQAGKLLRVNTIPDGIEFVNPSAAGGGAANTFTGLFVESKEHIGHDDSDEKIELIRLKSGTMDDGTVVNAVANLLLDLSLGNGVGALDTGTLANSTWYALMLVQRSDTEAFGLIATLADDASVDEQATSDDANAILNGATTNTDLIAQSFTPNVTAPLSHIDLFLNKLAAPTGSIWITIEGDNAGEPDGTPIATSESIDIATQETVEREITFVFHTPVSLTISVKKWIVVHADYTPSDTQNIRLRGNTTTVLAGEEALAFDGAAWSSTIDGSIVELWFREYPVRAGDSVFFPANYDRQLKLGYFQTTTVADILPFKQINNRIFYKSAHGVIMNSGTSNFTELTKINTHIPPGLIIVHANFTTSGGFAQMMVAGVPDGHSQTATGTSPNHLSVRHDIDSGNDLVSPVDILTETQGIYSDTSNTSSRNLGIHGFTFYE